MLAAGLSIEEATVLVRAFTSYFRLVDLAEDNERVRRVRTREREALPGPRRSSLREAIEIVAARGRSAGGLRELLAHAKIRPVSTAHPTEARRRTTRRAGHRPRAIQTPQNSSATAAGDGHRRSSKA